MSGNYSRTLALEVVRHALTLGYRAVEANARARKHFRFRYQGVGSPDIGIDWIGAEPSVTVGDTVTSPGHALELLKRYW